MSEPFSADELALLAAIHAEPKSDLPRLVYADWLDDRGETEHAEFIRLQCQHHDTVIAGEEKRHYITSRERELLRRFKQPWCRPLTRRLRLFAYHGGLPLVQFRMDGDAALSRIENLTPDDLTRTLAAVNPRDRFALLLCEGPVLGDLLQHEMVGRAAFLGITTGPEHIGRVGRHGVTADAVTALDRCPYLNRLWYVQLDGMEVEAYAHAHRTLKHRVLTRGEMPIRLISSRWH